MREEILMRAIHLVRDFKRQINKKNISAFASSTAFFLFVSLIPMLILLCSILPYTALTEADLMTFLTDLTPDVIDSFVVSIIADVYDRSIGVVSIAAISTLWSAGKGMMALLRGLNAINDVEEGRGYLMLRGISSFYTVIFLGVTVLSLVVIVFGGVLVQAVIRVIPQLERLFHFLMNFRLLFVLAIMIIVFSMMYTYIPDKKLKLVFQVPGAVFSAILWNLFSWAFSIYVESGANGFSTYGNLATIVIIMIWLYICIYIIMIGAYVNRYFSPVFHFLFICRQIRKAG
ncbi:MAG: YihY/virulence factor BrkB family protein [Kineothrix sp.]